MPRVQQSGLLGPVCKQIAKLCGDLAYNKLVQGILFQADYLRDPMKEWMMMMALMDEEDELDDAVDGMLKDRRRLKSDDLI